MSSFGYRLVRGGEEYEVGSVPNGTILLRLFWHVVVCAVSNWQCMKWAVT